MDRTELIQLRANILGGMNSYIIEDGDEDIYDYWFTYGVPDECTEEQLMEIAENDDLWLTCINAFDRCCRSMEVYQAVM